MTTLFALAVSFLSLPSIQDPAPARALPEVGDPALALQFDHVIGGAAGATSVDLAGKVAVIEFSTSWCGGCRASVPHWNAVAEELAGEAIAFVSVTNESKQTAETFAADVGLATPLAVDLDGSLFEAFGVGGVPDVVVIGADGKILGFTHPGRLAAADLRRAIAGQPVAFSGLPRAERNWNHSEAVSGTEIAANTFSVRPCAKPSGMMRMDPKTGAMFAGGLPMSVLFARVLECDARDLELDPALPTKTLYELRARGGDDTLEGTRAFARDRLVDELGVTVTKSMIEGKALILRRTEGHDGPPRADASSKSGGLRHGEIKLGSTTGAKLAAALRAFLPSPVFDESGLTEPFSLNLTWDPQQGLAGLREALATVGLRLEDGVRESPRYKIAPRA